MDNEPAAQASSPAMQPSRPVERSSPSAAHGARPSYEDGIAWGNAKNVAATLFPFLAEHAELSDADEVLALWEWAVNRIYNTTPSQGGE